jgi:DNA ligase-1
MKAFAALYQRLDRSTATLDKRAALVAYFRDARPHDAAWALYLLSGGKVGGARRRIAASGELRAWIAEAAALPPWLVSDSYDQVGDLAETLTLLLDDPAEAAPDRPLAEWIEQHLLAVANQPEAVRRAAVEAGWTQLPAAERLVFN